MKDEMIRLARARRAAGGTTLVSLADASTICDVRPGTLRHWVANDVVRRYSAPPPAPRRSVVVDLGEVLAVRDRSVIHPPGSPISYWQMEIMRLAASGYTTAQIADRTDRPLDTVKSAVLAVMRALGARSRTHAAVICVTRGLISAEGVEIPEDINPTNGQFAGIVDVGMGAL